MPPNTNYSIEERKHVQTWSPTMELLVLETTGETMVKKWQDVKPASGIPSHSTDYRSFMTFRMSGLGLSMSLVRL